MDRDRMVPYRRHRDRRMAPITRDPDRTIRVHRSRDRIAPDRDRTDRIILNRDLGGKTSATKSREPSQ